jgi:hypothetical protein
VRTTPCSEPLLLVIEGMPGAGKTTLTQTLATHGVPTLGEYVTSTGATLPWQDHPDVHDDDAHQRNWTDKHAYAHTEGHRIACDRDWLSALSYAASANDPALLARRADWALTALDQGRLCVPHHYLVLHLDPAASLARRADRLTTGHPWSTRSGLELLAAFYRDPPTALRTINSPLADRLDRATWTHLSAPPRPLALRTARQLWQVPA